MIAKKSSGVPLTLGVSAVGIDFGYYSARLSFRKSGNRACIDQLKAEVRSKKAEGQAYSGIADRELASARLNEDESEPANFCLPPSYFCLQMIDAGSIV